MLKLLEILQSIYLDKLLFKSVEYKLGFNKAVDIVKLHGFSTDVIQESRRLRAEVEQLKIDNEFLKERLQLKKEEVSLLHQKNSNLNTAIQGQLNSDNKKAVKRVRHIKRILLNVSKTPNEKVSGALAYIKSIVELNTLEDESSE